jgi:hypothetical protein
MNSKPTKSPLRLPISLIVFLGLAAFIFAVLAVSVWRRNDYNVYALSQLKWAGIITILFFGAAYVLALVLFEKIANAVSAKELRRQAALGLIVGLVVSWFWPAAAPMVPLPGSLQIEALGQQNPASSGANVEIRKITNLDGTAIGLKRFQLSGDWKIQNGRLVSQGQVPGALAEYHGPVAGGIVLDLRYNVDGGKAVVTLDGTNSPLDLYSDRGVSYPQAFGKAIWQNAAWQQRLVTGLAFIFQVVGVALLVLGLWMLSTLQWRFLPLLMALAFAAIFLGYLRVKLDYAQFNGGRAFRDTSTYVKTAEQPIKSSAFWIGERTFTLPLAYKLLHIDSKNFTQANRLKAVDSMQTWLSILSWTSLALALALTLRRPWLGLLAFGLVLYFSLNLEVSIWDSLLLSESISFSLFALLLAAWIGLGLLPRNWQAGLVSWVYLASVMLITILYSFTRDTNLYFVLAGAAVLLLVSLWLKSSFVIPRKLVYTYSAFALALFVFQTATVQAGNRWEIHIYDHLALRILPNPAVRQYYVDAGLPVTPDLMAITHMLGYQYHDYLDFDPRMAAVRAWIQARGRATFLKYMLSHPSQTFLEPFRQASQLVNGSNLEYRYPRYAMQPVPETVTLLNDQFYPHQPWILWLNSVLILIGLLLDWRSREWYQPAWWVLAAIALSLYPLMLVVWNGNPLEIERHAAQIGIQYRLGGLMALLLILAWVEQAVRLRGETDSTPQGLSSSKAG